MILSRKQIQQVIPLLFLWNICHVHAFSIKPTGRSTTFRKASTDSDNGEWSITDDWSSLSSDTVENRNIDSSKLFNQDFALYAASEMEKRQTPIPASKEDVWISDVIDEIHNSFSTLPLYDTGFDEQKVDNTTASSMDQEIAMLVRCNEYPEGLLIYEGRALPPLTERERNDPFQLVSLRDESTSFQMTEFLKHSVAMMFQKHALPDPRDGIPSLDRKGVARWMTTCLKTEEKKPTSAHEKRVLQTISNFGRYGSGRLIQADLEDLYLSTIVGDPQKVDTGRVSPMRHLELRKPFLDAVWRDIRNHGILSPVEAERQKLINEIQPSETTNDHHQVSSTTLMDECEIVDWDFSEQRLSEEKHSDKRQARGSKSSHKGVELASDRKTPLFMRDGKFVFIDEESCIGCMQCANVSPSSFMMLDSGRARTFQQRNAPDVDQAVASCPVNCMHRVSYRELQEFETARDDGDGRTDHKHLNGQGRHTPLFVAGIDSDNNHKSSWYHTLKHRCLMSSECPQKGCYDCPQYSNPGDNPYFKINHKAAEHTRAMHFTKNGDADLWRKSADL